jgi:hypothetical protein
MFVELHTVQQQAKMGTCVEYLLKFSALIEP